jgi:hypothetical protein
MDITESKLFEKFSNFIEKNTHFTNAIYLFLVFLMVVLPRFNRNDIFIRRPLSDALHYITYTHYFRGNILQPPFNTLPEIHSWKPIVPYLASWLPFDAMTSLNIINMLFLLMGIWALYRLFDHFYIKKTLVWLGLYIFVVSFPMFYYATIGYLDAAAVGLVCLGLWCLFAQHWWALFLIIVLGNWAKESVLVLVPATFLYVYAFKKNRWWWAMPALFLSGYTVSSWLIRQLAPTIFRGIATHRYNHPNDGNFAGFWHIKSQILMDNLSNPHFYGSYILSFLPLLGMMWYVGRLRVGIFSANKKVLYIFLAGIATSLAMHTFALLAGVPDGRLLWVSYPFGVLYIVYLLQNHLDTKPKSHIKIV